MEKMNILIVDDVDENIFSLRYLLEENFVNINVLEATNVKDALILIMKNEIDLILSDIQMPEIDGFQFVEYLQSVDVTRSIPIILITGIYNNEMYQKKAYMASSEVVDFITKPIDNDIFCAKLNVFIKIFEERKRNKKELAKKEKLLVEQIKINSILDTLEDDYSDIKESILDSDEFSQLLEDDGIDLELIKTKG